MHIDQEGNFEKMSESDWNSASDQSIITSKRPAVFDQERDRNVRFDKNQSHLSYPRSIGSSPLYLGGGRKFVKYIISPLP